jgi:hypothetical protein
MSSGTVFQRFVNCLHGTVNHPLVDMRVHGVGELTHYDTYWHLSYDECGHVQEFAREGLDEPEGAAFFVRRHYAHCLTCALAGPVAAEMSNVDPNQFQLVLSRDELTVTIAALRVVNQPELAERLDAILRQINRPL